MAETCGGVGFGAYCQAPKNQDSNPLKNYMEKRWEHKQNVRIDELQEKAETEGLSTTEKMELAAIKFDLATRHLEKNPLVMYMA